MAGTGATAPDLERGVPEDRASTRADRGGGARARPPAPHGVARKHGPTPPKVAWTRPLASWIVERAG